MQKRPNIILITAHDLGRHLHVYGIPTVRTPHLDDFAEEAVLFNRAFAVAPQCSPSRAALATGRYPHSNGVMGLTHPPFSWDLYPGERHVAQILGKHGYDTHLFGHQHVTPDVNRLGFKHVHRYEGAALGQVVAPQVVGFLAANRLIEPIYLEINLEEVHRPYDQGGVRPESDLGVYVPPYLPQGEEARQEMERLQGSIHEVDAEVGRILTGIRDSGLAGRSIVIFTTDHGIAMPGAKCTLYTRGLEITLLIRFPEIAPAAVSAIISNIDILPTLLESADIPVPESVQGRSFLRLLAGRPYTPRVAVYAEKSYHSYYDPMRAVLSERFELIRNFETAFQVEVPADIALGPIFRAHVERYLGSGGHPDVELYDLAADPFQTSNLSDEPAFSAIQVDLDNMLWTWMRDTEDPLLMGPIPSPQYRRSMAARPAAS